MTAGPPTPKPRPGAALHAVAAALTLLVWAPLAAPGYVLSYDMVFVPRQPLRWDLVAPGGGLPRAVPLDAVVSVLNLAVPGWLLQRLVLAGIVYAAALGAGRLVPAARPLTRIAAAVAYAWTPFLAERLLLGQWALLVAYAAFPWLVGAAMSLRRGEPGALPRLILPAAASAITPTGGLIALVTTVVLTADRPARRRADPGAGPAAGAMRRAGPAAGAMRRAGLAAGAVALLNAPWVVAALVTRATGRSDPAGVAAFAPRGENWSGPLGALAGTGGIWNAETTPASRGSVLVPLVTVGLLLLAGYGFPLLRRGWPDGVAVRLAGLAAGGVALAAAGLTPGVATAVEWAVRSVPGAGLVRDGQKLLIPYALVLALGVALGAQRLADRLAPARARLVLIAVAVVPLALMPDLALAGAGALRPVTYPDDWDRVRAEVAADPGPVIVLPFHLYRAYPWNRGRTVIDPAPRYLPAEVSVDDTLYVGDRAVRGEDPRAAEIRAVLTAGRSLTETGARWVLVERGAGGSFPASALTGLTAIHRGDTLDLYANPRAGPAPPRDAGRTALILTAYAAALAVVVIAAGCRIRRRTTPW